MNVFLKTAAITVFVFSLGLGMGLWLDLARQADVERSLIDTSIEISDVFTLDLLYRTFINGSSFCEAAVRSNLEFNQRIYQEGIELDRLETINKLGPDVLSKKRRYALLQMQFWLNAIQIKNRCNADYDNVVYMYNYEDTPQEKIDQAVQSNVLTDLKNKCGNRVMLIPIPIDIGIASIDTVKYHYNIEKVPTVLINEEVLLQGVQRLGTLESYVSC